MRKGSNSEPLKPNFHSYKILEFYKNISIFVVLENIELTMEGIEEYDEVNFFRMSESRTIHVKLEDLRHKYLIKYDICESLMIGNRKYRFWGDITVKSIKRPILTPIPPESFKVLNIHEQWSSKSSAVKLHFELLNKKINAYNSNYRKWIVFFDFPEESELSSICFGKNISQSLEMHTLTHPKFHSIEDLLKAGEKSGDLTIRFSAALVENCKRNHDSVVERMNTLLAKGEYTDVTLKFHAREFKAHRLILALYSVKFEEIFQADSFANEIEVKVELDPDAIEGMFQYVYTGKSVNLAKKPHEMFEVAHFFNIELLENRCLGHLQSNIRTENVVKTLKLIEKYLLEDHRPKLRDSLKELSIKTWLYIVENGMKQLKNEPDFVDYLTQRLDPQNAADHLSMAHCYDMTNFKTIVIDFIIYNVSEVVKNDNFKELYNTSPNLILEINEYASSKSQNSINVVELEQSIGLCLIEK